MWIPSKKARLWMEHDEFIIIRYDGGKIIQKLKKNAPKEIKESFDLYQKELQKIEEEKKEAYEKDGIIINY